MLAGADVNLDLIRSVDYREDLLRRALFNKDEDVIRFLLGRGARATYTDYQPHEGTLLAHAASYPLTELLLQHGALEPIAKDSELQRKFLVAKFQGNHIHDPKIISLCQRVLEEQYNKKFYFDTKDSSGVTLLMTLCIFALR